MPYITKDRRKTLDDCLLKKIQFNIKGKGELTYCIYRMALSYIMTQKESYQNISEAIAAISDAEHELRRRVLDPYENKKIKENGDI